MVHAEARSGASPALKYCDHDMRVNLRVCAGDLAEAANQVAPLPLQHFLTRVASNQSCGHVVLRILVTHSAGDPGRHFAILLRMESQELREKQKSLLVVYAGGTMGMKRNEVREGLPLQSCLFCSCTQSGAFAPVPGYLAQVMKEMPELTSELRGGKAMPKYSLIEYVSTAAVSNFPAYDFLTLSIITKVLSTLG